ncbi:programmed cell death protein 4-like isoform X2 [Gordionus sp. m RMFG-2023]|uniref:programmed cell death protein 4-like isoform X2 n=1 Tax=Gordionus sp. m RMFG-2023 TaxID=3053472 RepID=UPI0031FDC994
MINNFHDEKEMGILLNDNSLNEKDRVDIYYDLSNTKNHFTKVAKRFNNKFLTIKSINDNLYSTSQEPINIKTFYSNPYGAKNHRKPRNGKGRGLPKKGGAGGKGTWGKFGEDYSNENHACYIDKNDPNYDSECSQDIITEISIPELERHMLAAKVEPIIHEYFNHGNTQEVIKSLTELNIPLDLRPQVACLAIRIALDLKDSDRELTSILLSEFSHYTQHGNHKKSIYTESNSNILDGSNNFMLTRDHFKSAFQEILRNLDDYVMDIPGVAQIVGNFIARALADDCFDASIFSDMEAHFADKGPTRELIKLSLNQARCLLNLPLYTKTNFDLNTRAPLAALSQIWGISGSVIPVKTLMKTITRILKNFLYSDIRSTVNDINVSKNRASSYGKNEFENAGQALRELNVPHFNHEYVYRAIKLALQDGTKKNAFKIRHLLAYLVDVDDCLDYNSVDKGFERIIENLPELSYSIPNAQLLFEKFVEMCCEDDWENMINENQ